MVDYLPCSPVQPLLLEWLHYASVAGMHNLVQVRWYDKAKVYLLTTTVYDSTENPTSWTRKTAFAIPPAGAQFWKIRIIGGYTDTDIAGTAYWDGVSRRSDFVDYPVLKHDSYNEGDSLSTDYVGVVHVLDVSAVQGTAASLILQLHDINFSFEDTYKALYAYMF